MVTCYFSGRMGNIFYNVAQLVAFARKYNLKYYIPTEANAYKGFTGDNKVPFNIKSTGHEPVNPIDYNEPNHVDGNPCFHDIPGMDNVRFLGYFQSFRYFDWCRDHIISVFKLPYKMENGVTSISVRRGDCVNEPRFPIAPKSYYVGAVNYMLERGFDRFRVFSDDIFWCKSNFNKINFPDANFEFYEGQSEINNYIGLSCCENNITARSTFSLTAAWMNQNESKIVCVPTIRHHWWRSMNLDLLTGTNFVQIDFENPTDEWSN